MRVVFTYLLYCYRDFPTTAKIDGLVPTEDVRYTIVMPNCGPVGMQTLITYTQALAIVGMNSTLIRAKSAAEVQRILDAIIEDRPHTPGIAEVVALYRKPGLSFRTLGPGYNTLNERGFACTLLVPSGGNFIHVKGHAVYVAPHFRS